MNKIIIITAPSGSGKTTIVKRLLSEQPALLGFSISATTRSPRAGELDGRDYYFLNEDTFKAQIAADAFIEWEMVYTGKYYGTLKTEIDRLWQQGKAPLVDIDVQGALNIKQQYPDQVITIFIQAPSMQELEKRLTARGTESKQSLRERLDKAADELSYAAQFDIIIVNDNLEKAISETTAVIGNFLQKHPVV